MRIAIDIRMLNYSGIGTYIENLVKNLSQIDSKNEYILINSGEELPDLPSNFKFRNIHSKVFSLSEHYKLPFILKEEGIDIFHFPHFYSLFFCACKGVVTIHDLIFSIFPAETSMPGRLYYNLMIKHSLKIAKKIIAVSHNTKRDIMNFFGIPDAKIEVIYEGIDKIFHPIDDRVVLENIKQKYNIDAQFILYVGLKKPHKNLSRLIRAFGLWKRSGRKGKLVIVGKEDVRYSLKPLVEEFGLNNEVVFTGYIPREDLVLLYNAAEIFVFPSLYEGFGLPVLEAMACGKPIIASNCSSLPEIVGDCAVLINPYDIEEMANVIKVVLDDEKLKRDLSQKALDRSKFFSWSKCAEQTIDVYESVM